MAGRRKLLTPQGPQDWRIVFKQLSRGYCGLCHFDKRTIEVCNRLSDELTMQSLIHEAAHVALGEDYGEPAIERIEHNVYVALLPWLKQRFDIMED